MCRAIESVEVSLYDQAKANRRSWAGTWVYIYQARRTQAIATWVPIMMQNQSDALARRSLRTSQKAVCVCEHAMLPGKGVSCARVLGSQKAKFVR